jgi:type IV pilus assembly protein PilV
MPNYLSPRRARGVSLVEVLVAILVLAVGMLGLAALQARGLKFNHDAYARSQATLLAYQIMESMRVRNNPEVDDDLDVYLTETDPRGPPPHDPGDLCDPVAISVENDLHCWFDAIQAVLPSGDARIGANAESYDITLRWQERGARDPANEADCEGIPAREWDGDASVCRVIQTWTFRPARNPA